MSQDQLSDYKQKPLLFFNGHLETILPTLLFCSASVAYSREILNLHDGDSVALDWVKGDNRKLIVITHGMEGSSERFYVKRAANYFSSKNWDVLAWNARGCGGIRSKVVKLAHHGSAEDLSQIVHYALEGDYEEIVLFGFSMGGSQSLKYLSGDNLDDRILGGIGISVTFGFEDMMNQLQRPGNFLYRKIFLDKMKSKMLEYRELGLDVEISILRKIEDFHVFHTNYTAPLNGFGSLEEFYQEASTVQCIGQLKRPFLAVNALNDPFLGEANYPLALSGGNFHIETPEQGGHLGFNLYRKPYSYMELRAERFIQDNLRVHSFR